MSGPEDLDDLDDAALEFHGRHVMLDAIGIAGQQKIAKATVLLVGVGGLGCPAGQYLATCGVGKIILVDDDRVEKSNLQRQLLFRTGNVGEPKAPVAAAALRDTNPHIQVEPKTLRATAANLPTLLNGVDIVIDGCDNFATRHAVNQACHDRRTSLVAGAAEQFDGQLVVLDFARSTAPCYACLFPATATPVEPTPCATLGVFAPLTGLIGSLMAAEAIRLLAFPDHHPGLRSRMLAYDLLGQRVRQVKLKPAANCAVCGGNA